MINRCWFLLVPFVTAVITAWTAAGAEPTAQPAAPADAEAAATDPGDIDPEDS